MKPENKARIFYGIVIALAFSYASLSQAAKPDPKKAAEEAVAAAKTKAPPAVTVAEGEVAISTGSAAGTYSVMCSELAKKVISTVKVKCVASGGSLDNLQKVMGNQLQMGFVQSDALAFRALREDLSSIQTHSVMHLEEIHFVAPVSREPVLTATEKAKALFGNKPPAWTPKTISDLNGRRVGAYGGSIITAKIVKAIASLSYEVVELETPAQLQKALEDGTVDGAVYTGGAQLSAVEAYGKDMRLLSIASADLEKLGKSYVPVRLSYSNLADSDGVDGIAVEALLITTSFADKNQMLPLRSAIATAIPEMQRTVGFHKKWRQVKPGAQGKWKFWYTGN